MKLKPLHAGISVADMDESIRWYGDVLGFEFVRLDEVEQLGAKIAFLRHGDFEIELFEHRDRRPVPDDRRHPDTDMVTQGTKHIAFAVADFEDAVARLRQKGVDFAKEPFEMTGTPVCFIRDPSGTVIELIGTGGN